MQTHSPFLVVYMIYFNGVGSTPDLTSSICWGFPERYATSSGVEDDDGRPFVANRCALLWHCQGAKYKVFNDCYQDLWAKFYCDSRESHNRIWKMKVFPLAKIVVNFIGRSLCKNYKKGLLLMSLDALRIWIIQIQPVKYFVCTAYKKELSDSLIFRFFRESAPPEKQSRPALDSIFSFWECLHLKARREGGCAAV